MIFYPSDDRPIPNTSGINKMVCAAVLSHDFCSLLLSNPILASEIGYAGERFTLSEHELALLVTIRATNISSFAEQVFRLTAKGESDKLFSKDYVELDYSE